MSGVAITDRVEYPVRQRSVAVAHGTPGQLPAGHGARDWTDAPVLPVGHGERPDEYSAALGGMMAGQQAVLRTTPDFATPWAT